MGKLTLISVWVIATGYLAYCFVNVYSLAGDMELMIDMIVNARAGENTAVRIAYAYQIQSDQLMYLARGCVCLFIAMTTLRLIAIAEAKDINVAGR